MQTVNHEIQKNKESSNLEDSLFYILKDCFKYAPSKILGMLMNLMLVPVYTSLLLPEQYGLYHVSIAFLSFIAVIFSDWVGLSGLRFFKSHHKINSVHSYFSTLLFLITTNLAIMYAVVTLFYDNLKDFFNIPGYALVSVVLLIIPVALRALQFQVLRAQIKPIIYSIIIIFNQITTIGFAYYFIKYHNLGSMGILAGMAVSITIVDIIMFFATGLWKGMKPKFIDFSTLKNFYWYGLPIALSSLGMWIITQSNKIVIQKFHPELVGAVGVSYNLSFSTLFPLFAILTLAAVPRIINLYEDNIDIRPVVSKMTAYFMVMFAPCVMIYCIFAKDIVLTFSNAKYLDAVIFIQFLALSAFFFGLAEYTVIQYHLIKKTYIHTLIKIIPSIIGLVAGILLLPNYEGYNAMLVLGITTLSSQILYFLLSLVIRIKDLSWQPPYKTIAKLLTALCGSYAIYTWYSTMTEFNNLFVNSAIVGIFYVLILKILKVKFRNLKI